MHPPRHKYRSLMSSAAADTIHTEKKPAGIPQPGAEKDRPYRTKSRLSGRYASSQSTLTGKAKPSVSVTEQSYLRNLISVSTSYILLLPYRVSIAVLWLSVKHLLSSRVPVINTSSISARDNPSTQPYLIHHPGHIYLSLPHIRLPNRSCLQIPIL